MNTLTKEYEGFEIGPIRPPIEAYSFLVRVTRNCSWNKCKFCGLYKGTKFSLRPIEHIKKDIDKMKEITDSFAELEELEGIEKNIRFKELRNKYSDEEEAFVSAYYFYQAGMKTIFLQDANSMVVKPDILVEILEYLKQAFPNVERTTIYGRASTIVKISDEDLKRISDAGLTRIDVGIETASDTVLELVNKGTTKEKQILAGQKIKKAGIELSVYYIPGLGGVEYSKENALETADAINQINPDYIGIRFLALKPNVPLYEDYQNGIFTRTNDTQMIEEVLLMISHLEGITSTLLSEHIVNLIPEVSGVFPQDKDQIINVMNKYLQLSEEDKIIYRVGKRAGFMNRFSDFYDDGVKLQVKNFINENNINKENVDDFTDSVIRRYM